MKALEVNSGAFLYVLQKKADDFRSNLLNKSTFDPM